MGLGDPCRGCSAVVPHVKKILKLLCSPAASWSAVPFCCVDSLFALFAAFCHNVCGHHAQRDETPNCSLNS